MKIWWTAFLIFFLPLFYQPFAQAGDPRLENSRFVIYYEARDGFLAAELERESLSIRKRIIADIGVDFYEKTEVRLCATLEAFRDAQPDRNRVPLWAVGVAYPGDNIIVLRSPRAVPGSSVDVLSVFAHEFSHIALGRALMDVAVPIWLDEGLAMYEAREWTFSRFAVLSGAALTDRLIPLAVLTGAFPGDTDQAELAYAESFMFVSFLINKAGQGAFHRLIRDFTRYGDLEGAFRRATGMSGAALEKEWLFYLKLRVSWIPIITSVSTLWFVTTLIFIYGYYRKKRQAAKRLREMEEEEGGNDPQDIWH